MWYVFPQYAGLGSSMMSREYAIQSTAEAHSYLEHSLLGNRLRECCEAVLLSESRSATELFGSPDDMKLHSCVTLFAAVSVPGSVFHRVLDKYFGGIPDRRTLEIINGSA